MSLNTLTKAGSLGGYLLGQMQRAFQDISTLAPEIQSNLPRLVSRILLSAQTRQDAWHNRQLNVPTIAFLAITGECNLRCPHCYTQKYERERMPIDLARRIVTQAYELGVALVVVTGGEPLLYPEFFEITRDFSDMPFLVFSNGLRVREFLKSRAEVNNLIWAISIDGPRAFTDARRGAGTYDAAQAALAELAARGLPFGFSSTLGADNVTVATNPDFVIALAAQGCRAGIYLEQIPHPECDPPLGARIVEGLHHLREEGPIPVIGFPADEFLYGGCQAAGQGMVHVSPDGMLEPCPAARIAADSLEKI